MHWGLFERLVCERVLKASKHISLTEFGQFGPIKSGESRRAAWLRLIRIQVCFLNFTSQVHMLYGTPAGQPPPQVWFFWETLQQDEQLTLSTVLSGWPNGGLSGGLKPPCLTVSKVCLRSWDLKGKNNRGETKHDCDMDNCKDQPQHPRDRQVEWITLIIMSRRHFFSDTGMSHAQHWSTPWALRHVPLSIPRWMVLQSKANAIGCYWVKPLPSGVEHGLQQCLDGSMSGHKVSLRNTAL